MENNRFKKLCNKIDSNTYANFQMLSGISGLGLGMLSSYVGEACLSKRISKIEARIR